ncbi:hypothetical protein PR202_ga21501 [Eleusine coracana subsp. coracana]|uniref:Glycosyl hydrolase family 13 catalytic domain-containing protein n=1 Tax=Eleusine coracana subsp. coracana TaxID=191504 RepID=A0AAV5D149_ELECO|nr:hypothetical protein PR202_ga21501 [Eleusine coracana subsp. coracana]
MAQLPCVSVARPLLAVPPSRGRWHGPRVRRPNAAGRRVAAGVRTATGPVAAAVEAEVDDEDDDDEEEEVPVERYALGGACKVLAGMPEPLGATALAGGVNFAVYSSGASAAALCLFTPDDLNASQVTEEVPLHPKFNRTGSVWHVFIEGEQLHTMLYAYRFDGVFAPERGQYYDVSNIVVDPYAKAVISRGQYGVPAPGGDCWPQMAGMIPLPHSMFDWQGDLPLSYHQKDLIIYEMHLRGFTKHDSSNSQHPGTYIGAVSKLDYLKELGVNCVELMPCHEFNELEYYSSSSKYWVMEMHVDGFRFDLASIMTRGCSLWDPVNVYGSPLEGDMITTGTPLVSPPLVDMISNDPILGGVKYRDTVRQFIKGTDGFAGAFAECLCGSPHLYQAGGRKPWHSVNFVCAHDGFTLADLVTYNNKYNLSNGEDNRDGENHNLSWNCGEEGEFASLSVRRLRKRQMRNFFVCLMVSQGVPMFYMGDEYGHTKGGNNNTYCHDHYVNYFRWDKKEEQSSDLYRFCRLMTKFRQECESLGLEDFPTSERLQWHGHQPGRPDWSEGSRFVAFSMKDETKGEIYVAFNTSHLPVVVGLPERPGYRWEPVVDTGKPAPYDFLTDDLPDRMLTIHQFSHFLTSNLYPMLSYSSIILVSRPDV